MHRKSSPFRVSIRPVRGATGARYGGKIGNTPVIWALKALLVSKRDDNAVTKGIQGITLVGFLVSQRKGSMVPSSVEGKA
jgi:hypothetical protein